MFNQVSIARLREALDYEPKDGIFRWKVRPARNIRIGDRAGTAKARRNSQGEKQAYYYIRLDGVEMSAGQVAWAFVREAWPDRTVTFIDGDPLNPKLTNLKLGGSYERKLPTEREMTVEDASQVWSYNPITGALTWKISPSAQIPAGSPAGASPGKKGWVDRNGVTRAYSFISYKGFQGPAARIAWLLGRGEWPKSNVLFVDRDPFNLRLSNLRMRDPALYEIVGDGSRKMSKAAVRRYSLKRYYDLTPEEYAAKLKAQKWVCAICGEPETSADRYGNLRLLQVDHDHQDNHVRELLCFTVKASSRYGTPRLRTSWSISYVIWYVLVS